MRARTGLKLCLAFLLVLFASTSVSGDKKGVHIEAARKKCETVANMIKGKQISRLDILHVPYIISGGGSGDPRQMPRACTYQLIIRGVTWVKERRVLAEALLETDFRSVTRDIAPRWGLVFYDAKGKECASILLDGFGNRAFVNNIAFDVNTKLVSWLERNYLKCFEVN